MAEDSAAEPERGIDAYKRHQQERRERAQQAKRARFEGDGGEYGGPSTSQAAGAAAAEVKESDLHFVPDGWFSCPCFGEPIGKFIPSKVPLSAAYNKRIPEDKQFTPKDIVQKQAALGRQIGLVINLTRSKVYYHIKQWEEQGIDVVEIKCQGRGEAPTAEQVNSFWYTANSYFVHQQDPENQKYILVHCTHGFNRTGYMICHMLMRSPHIFQRYLTVKEVIAKFAEARAPGIFKPLYLKSLFDYYHESDVGFTPPELPLWKTGGIEDDDDFVDAEDLKQAVDEEEKEGEGGKEKKKKRNEEMKHDDILGEPITGHHKLEIQNLIRMSILNPQNPSSQNIRHFPGSQPVSFSRDNMQLLEKKRYYVTWKADGTRYMLLSVNDGVYLISRSFDVRRLQLRLPLWGLDKKGMPTKFKFVPQHLTLLDGEMVVDEDPGTGEKKRRFYAYDLMSLNGKRVTELPFKQRFAYIEDYVVKPRKMEQFCIEKEKERYPYHMYKYDDEGFTIRRKSFYPLHASGKVLTNLIPKLLHESDGLIFQDWEDSYEPLTCPDLLKWKYSHLNSVDFKLEAQPKAGAASGGGGEKNSDDYDYSLSVQRGGRPMPLEDAQITFPNHINPLDFVNTIIECTYNADFKTWVFLRDRVDKETANDFNVYRKVVKSIEDNIGEEEIIAFTQKASQEPMYEKDRNRPAGV